MNIASPKQLERWLNGKPRAWAVSISARATLRSLPALAVWGVERSGFYANTELPLAVFRETLIAVAAATEPTKDIKALALAAAITSTRAAKATITAGDEVPYITTGTAMATVYANASDAPKAAATNALATVSDASYAVTNLDATQDCWLAISSDARALATSLSDTPVAALLREPLWPQNDGPHWARDGWAALRNSNALRDAGFAPWFDWYESLLPLPGASRTDRFGPALTRRIALQPSEWWDRGAEAVNADITAWLAEQDAEKAVPPQVPAAYRFNHEDERIGLTPLNATATDLTATQAFLNDLRERADQAAQRLENARNAAPFLADEVSRLRDFLPTSAVDLNPHLLRGRLITIDATVMTLQSAGPSRELADDPAIQVTALALAGRELLLCFPDLRTREREEIARAIPLGQERQVTEALAEASKAAARAPDVVTEQAAAALETMNAMAREAADGPPDAQRERIVEQMMVDRNFRSEVVRFGWDLWDRVQPGVLVGAKAVSKHAVIFGFAGLVSALTNPVYGVPAFGLAALFAGYGQINHGLKLLEELYTKRAKELRESAKKPKPDGQAPL